MEFPWYGFKLTEEAEAENSSSPNSPSLASYTLRSHPLQFSVRQLPSQGLSFQIWPAASALCCFLEQTFGLSGMSSSALSRLQELSSSSTSLSPRSSGIFRDDTAPSAAQMNSPSFPKPDFQTSPLHGDSSVLYETTTARMRVLELGAGTGMVGILSALLGADSTITDLPHVVPNLIHNASLNEQALKDSGRGGRISVRTLRWGEQADMQAIGRSFDLILASDVVYYDHLFEPLLQTLKWFLFEEKEYEEKRLQADPKQSVCAEAQTPFVLLAHLKRWKKDAHFFRKAAKLFDVKVVHTYSHHESSRTGIAVYCLTSKNHS